METVRANTRRWLAALRSRGFFFVHWRWAFAHHWYQFTIITHTQTQVVMMILTVSEATHCARRQLCYRSCVRARTVRLYVGVHQRVGFRVYYHFTDYHRYHRDLLPPAILRIAIIVVIIIWSWESVCGDLYVCKGNLKKYTLFLFLLPTVSSQPSSASPTALAIRLGVTRDRWTAEERWDDGTAHT